MKNLCMALLMIALGGGQATSAQEADHQPLTVDYADWDRVLQETVMPTGRSDRMPAPTIKSQAGSRLSHTNPNLTRLEANRVFFHALGADNIAYVRRIRDSLAHLPDVVALERLGADERLAYWLNLHNVTVYLAVAEIYPETLLKDLADDIWEQDLLTVEGRGMSIADIERHVVATWRDPLVLYGLYSGAVGGPNLRRAAFTGTGVWDDLKDNALDFVGSLRGVQFRGDMAHVSKLYELARPLFADFDSGLKRHMQAHADAKVSADLENAARFIPDVYDWYIADLYNGHLGLGSAANTNPAGLIYALASNPNVSPNFVNMVISKTGASKFPPHVQQFLIQLEERNRKLRTPEVTVEEIAAPGE